MAFKSLATFLSVTVLGFLFVFDSNLLNDQAHRHHPHAQAQLAPDPAAESPDPLPTDPQHPPAPASLRTSLVPSSPAPVAAAPSLVPSISVASLPGAPALLQRLRGPAAGPPQHEAASASAALAQLEQRWNSPLLPPPAAAPEEPAARAPEPEAEADQGPPEAQPSEDSLLQEYERRLSLLSPAGAQARAPARAPVRAREASEGGAEDAFERRLGLLSPAEAPGPAPAPAQVPGPAFVEAASEDTGAAAGAQGSCRAQGHCGSCLPSPADRALCPDQCFPDQGAKLASCSVSLKPIARKVKMMGEELKQEEGASGAQILTGKVTPQGTDAAGGTGTKFVVKIHNPKKEDEALRNIISMQLLLAECGSPVNYIRSSVRDVKRKGKLVRAQLMDMAEGTSLASLVDPPSPSKHELLQKLVKAARPHLAPLAILELLFAGGDTNPGNVFLTPEGRITIIDLDAYLEAGAGANRCSSVLLPGSRSHVKRPALRALDYRCHVPGGKIGTNFPPAIDRCVKKFAAMDSREMVTQYRIANRQTARLLQERAKNLMNLGFEEAMTRASCSLENNEAAPKSAAARKPRDLLKKYVPCCTAPPYHDMDKKAQKSLISEKCEA